MATITIGRMVLYILSEADAEVINRRRVAGESYRSAGGTQKHVGSYHNEGDVVPLIVVRVWPDEFGPGIPRVNGQAILDGNDSLWVTSAKEGIEPGTWHWPHIEPQAPPAYLLPAASYEGINVSTTCEIPEAVLAATA